MLKRKDAYVGNAADVDQVRRAGGQERHDERVANEDLLWVMSEPMGRRFLWRLLAHCKTFESIWEPSARIHYLAGKQDTGHYLMGEIASVDEEGFLQMMKENQNG